MNPRTNPIFSISFKQLNSSRSAGFSLLEILIALAVLAIAFVSIQTATITQATHVAYLRDKTLAHWVAMNQMIQLQISKKWPSKGIKSGDDEMGSIKWHWVREIKDTPDDRVREVEIRIYRKKGDESSITSLISFLSQPI
jgi:general secretion pathway protein I